MPIDFRKMDGITFIDTVLIAEPKGAAGNYFSLLFHECVHVCQYRLLGVNRFIEEYVNGWANHDQNYYNIPLEKQAYGLESKFKAAPNEPFDVEAVVIKSWKHLI